MTFATSSAVPCRWKALGSSKGASEGLPLRSQCFCMRGVYIDPGATAFTRTSRGPFS